VTVKQITECFQSSGEKSGLVINGISLTNVNTISRSLCLLPLFVNMVKLLLNCVMFLV
jgi:hypothetical protein